MGNATNCSVLREGNEQHWNGMDFYDILIGFGRQIIHARQLFLERKIKELKALKEMDKFRTNLNVVVSTHRDLLVDYLLKYII